MKNGADFLVTVFRYLYEGSRIENKSDIDRIALESFSRETGEQVMTIAEQIRQEATLKATREATRKTKAKTTEAIARKLIDEGLDVTTIVRCTELTADEVKNLKSRRS